jgi:hypothetical protein
MPSSAFCSADDRPCIVIRRERAPQLSPRPTSLESQWRFCVAAYPDRHRYVAFFTNFSHAAARAE